jgi:hypothetical protein
MHAPLAAAHVLPLLHGALSATHVAPSWQWLTPTVKGLQIEMPPAAAPPMPVTRMSVTVLLCTPGGVKPGMADMAGMVKPGGMLPEEELVETEEELLPPPTVVTVVDVDDELLLLEQGRQKPLLHVPAEPMKPVFGQSTEDPHAVQSSEAAASTAWPAAAA